MRSKQRDTHHEKLTYEEVIEFLTDLIDAGFNEKIYFGYWMRNRIDKQFRERCSYLKIPEDAIYYYQKASHSVTVSANDLRFGDVRFDNSGKVIRITRKPRYHDRPLLWGIVSNHLGSSCGNGCRNAQGRNSIPDWAIGVYQFQSVEQMIEVMYLRNQESNISHIIHSLGKRLTRGINQGFYFEKENEEEATVVCDV